MAHILDINSSEEISMKVKSLLYGGGLLEILNFHFGKEWFTRGSVISLRNQSDSAFVK